jgi:hypothetical protein
VRKLDPKSVPVTSWLGILGIAGFAAYVGLRVIGQPRKGETVVVAAASGGVGTLVGQLAKKAGARAVGIAGGTQKCEFIKDELGFDAAIDHRSSQFEELLAKACPTGIDVYFENVGGEVFTAVWPLLNSYARMPICGNADGTELAVLISNGASDRLRRLSVNADECPPHVLRVTEADRLRDAFDRFGGRFYATSGHIGAEPFHHTRGCGAGLRPECATELASAHPDCFRQMFEGKRFGDVIAGVADGGGNAIVLRCQIDGGCEL